MRARIENRVLKHFSPNFDILAGAFIGSRFNHPDVSSEESDFDCFLLTTGPDASGSEIVVDQVSVHVVLIPLEIIDKYLQLNLVRCSWQFLTVIDWLRNGDIFYDPLELLCTYKQKATEWFTMNIGNFISTKLKEIEILLSKLSMPNRPENVSEKNFIAIYAAVETLRTLLLQKGIVFHGPKRFMRDLLSIYPRIYKSFAQILNLYSIDTHSVCSLITNTLKEIDCWPHQ